MQNKFYLILLFLASFSINIWGQIHQCGTDIYMNRLYNQNPSLQLANQRADSLWVDFKSKPIDPNKLVVYENNDTIYEIPVVFHVMHCDEPIGSRNNPSDAAIYAYLDYLNQSFAATFVHYATPQNGGVKVPIRFVMAKRTPGCNPSATNGINRVNVKATYPNYENHGVALEGTQGVPDYDLKALSRWDRSTYYNIWLVNYIDGPNNSAGGYAYLPPGAPGEGDGTVLLVEYTTPGSNGNYYKALPHELGHSFGLYHTFQGSSGANSCPSNANCLENNDRVCDTEVHSLNQNCPSNTAINNCTNQPFNNVQYNIMNYTTCNTGLRFTPGQRERMLHHLFTYRTSLIHSLGGVPLTVQPVNNLVQTACNPPLQPTNQNNLQGGPTLVKLGSFEYSTFNYNSDNLAYVDYACIVSPPTYTPNNSYTFQVKVNPLNTNSVALFIDYNNNGTFENSELVVTGATTNGTFTTNITIPNNAVTCTPIRMRVKADVGNANLSNSCSILLNGQVEDYAIIIKPAAPNPTVNITSNSGTTICAGSSVTFNSNVTNLPTGATYKWYVNNTVASNSINYTTNTIANNDQVKLIITYPSVCGAVDSITSNVLNMQVTSNATPTISIASNQSLTICQGQLISFTANVTNQGATPTFQWYVNNNPVGGNSSTFASSSLSNGDQVTCRITSSLACVTSNNILSNALVVVVTPTFVPAVTISTTNNNLCVNSTLTFTANPTNFGSTPTYQWKVNGVNISGATSSSYTSSTLNPNDVITVEMTTTANCASSSSAVSNSITVINTTTNTPSITISNNATNNSICEGNSITFTAASVSGGNNPIFEWRVNGVAQAGNANTFTTASLNNGDVVTCKLTSNSGCLFVDTAISNAMTISVTPKVTTTVSIVANPAYICNNTPITFTASTTNAGLTPSFQWFVNGVPVGTNSGTYTSSTFNSGDVVTCDVTVTDICVVNTTTSSNAVTLQTTTTVNPTIQIASNKGTTICNYDSVLVTATITNGGTNPTYIWSLNGIVLPQTTSSIFLNNINDGDVITAELISNEPCLQSPSSLSNALNFVVTTPNAITLTPDSDTLISICNPNQINFSVANANGAISWYVNDTLVPNVSATSLSAFKSGVYYALNTVNGCMAKSNSTQISIEPMAAPVLNFVNGGYEVDDVFDTYKWYFNNAQIMNNPTHRHIPHAYGYFKLCVTKDDCEACTEAVNYPDPLSVDDLEKDAIKVYPNPTNGNIYVEYTKALNLELRAVDGRVIKSAANAKQMNIAELASGVYTLYLINPVDGATIQIHKVFKD